MYHCQLTIYIVGKDGGVLADAVKDMRSPERFSCEFICGGEISSGPLEKADVIIAEPADLSELEALRTSNKPSRHIILFGEKALLSSLCDNFENTREFFDIWFVPMTRGEIRFRFSRLIEEIKREKDAWLESYYFNSVINITPNLVWFKDKNGIHLKVNDSFCKVVNKEKSLVEGRDHAFIWDVDMNDPNNAGMDCSKSDNEVMKSGKICVTDEIIKAGDSVKLLTTYKMPLYDLDGSVMGTVGVGADITQEDQYRRELVAKNRTLETVFTSLNCGVLCHSIDGSKIISVNDAALKILGYESVKELMDSGFNMVAQSVLDEDKPLVREKISALHNEGDTVDVEYRVRHKDGKMFNIMGNIKLLRENGELFYRRFLLDITARKKNEKRYSELVKALSIDYSMIWTFDINSGKGIAIRVSEEWSRFMKSAYSQGVPFEKVWGEFADNFIRDDDRQIIKNTLSRENLKKELLEKKSFHMNFRVVTGENEEYFEIKAVRAGTWDNERVAVIGLRNVDDEIRAEMQKNELLTEALEQTNRANKAKSAFLSNMSHDIRTPMNAVIGFANLALSHIDDNKRVEDYLGKIIISGNHMQELINNVLDISHIESGKLQLSETVCRMSDFLREFVNIITPDINSKNHSFIIDTFTVSHDEVYCDKLRLNQVLLNIVSNSVKYTESGGKISLSLIEKPSLSPEWSNYEFCVTDNGIGMSKEFLEHIYEPFERAKNTTMSGVQGSGLGMAIVKNVVDTMNGKINISSEQGKGTVTTVSLPLRVCEYSEKSVSAPETELENKNVNCRVLLVEDNKLNQEIAEAILSDAGFFVETADNGKLALDMLTAHEANYYGVVLMDVQMPVMNGYEAAKAIRALPDKKLAATPIVAMTANAFEEDKQTALQCGMNDHISKPIDIKKLFATLNKILTK